MTTDLRDRLETTLGASFRLEHELGGGGMSRVFVAEETALGRRVVIKVLPPELSAGVSAERFRREIQIAARLQHPHIVPVLTAGLAGGVLYYTMPLVEGHSLRARLAKNGPLPVGETASILREVARALAYAHEHGTVHRDIKPDNVLLCAGTAVVTDFGIAKALAAAKSGGERSEGASTKGLSVAELTAIGTSLGTPAYMAPEQAAADPGTDHRADLYAFGVMAYEMLTGRTPFHGRTPHRLLAAHMAERPLQVGELRLDTPPALAELVMRCLEKEPGDRPQSASELVRVLESVTSGSGLPTVPAVLLGGRRPLWRVLAYYTAATIGLGLISKASIVTIGLPDWVFPGTMLVMGLGLPVILFTAFVHYGAYQALTAAALTPGGSPVAQSTMSRLALKASPWVSWRRTTIGGVVALSAFVVLVAAFMTLRALGIGPAGSLLAAGKLKAKEPLLVADFRVRGADTSIVGVVSEAVRTDLGQSSAISILTPSAVANALARMNRPETSRVDLALARELAQREGVKAIVDGDVAPLGGGFVVSMRLVTADSGIELASYRAIADSPRELLAALDKVTRAMRGKIGESLRAVQASPPLEQVTTSSLEALKLYAAASRANDLGEFPRALGLLRQALAIDTGFAMAYRKLGVVMGNLGMSNEPIDSAASRAYHHRERLTERERLLAEAFYFDGDPGYDRPRAVAAYEAVLSRDSLEPIALTNLALLHMRRREFAAAESLDLREIAGGVAGAQEYPVIVNSRINQGRLADAESAMKAERAAFPRSPLTAMVDIPLLYARGRNDSVLIRLRDVRAGDHDARNRARATHWLANMMFLQGRIAEGGRLEADALAQDVARGAPAPPLDPELYAAWVDIWFRERPARGVQALDSALARTPLRTLSVSRRPYLSIAALYALAGRPDRARRVLTQYSSEVKDSVLLKWNEPELHDALAEIALAERRPLDAAAEFRVGDRRPDGPVDPCTPCLPARLGRAYDLANMPDSAIATYERYLATPGNGHFQGVPGTYHAPLDASVLAGVHKRLGELYETKGDNRRAAAHYAVFVKLWQNADPELQPKVADVKRRLARLGRLEPR